jgi:hypothetical protein
VKVLQGGLPYLSLLQFQICMHCCLHPRKRDVNPRAEPTRSYVPVLLRLCLVKSNRTLDSYL